jgi:hypothetical protein
MRAWKPRGVRVQELAFGAHGRVLATAGSSMSVVS